MSRYIDADKIKINVSYGQMRDDDVLLIPLGDVYKSIYTVPTADVKEIQKYGEWEMFDLISSAYFGKGMYFKQDNGTVYSRYSCKHMSVDEALREFVSLIDDSDVNLQPTVEAVDVVRCKDCVHYWKNHLKEEVDDAVAVCLASPKDDAFCSEGERREDGQI